MDNQDKQTIAKRKKPDFVLKESKFFARIKKRWRYPRGKHSPVRQRHKGRPPLPTPGYGSPRAIKYQTKKGVKEILVKKDVRLRT